MDDVRIAGPADADDVGRVLADGFGADPVLSWVFDEPDRAEKLGRLFGFLAVEALVPRGATYVLPGSCACWTPPATPDWPAERSQRFADVLGRCCTDAELTRLGAVDAAMQAAHPPEPLWYLGLIATEGAAQGRGLGSALLAASLRRVDADGLPAYLESTNPRNVSLYERHGFSVTGHLELPDGPTLTTMWRASTPR